MKTSKVEHQDGGARRPHLVNPIPEINPEIVKAVILGAFYDVQVESHAVFGPHVPRLYKNGEVVDGMLLATFAQTAGLEDPTLPDIMSAAEKYVARFSQKEVA